MNYKLPILFILLLLFLSSFVKAHGPVHERIDSLSVQIEKFPDDISLYLERGTLYKVDGDVQQSIADFLMVLGLNENVNVARFQLADLYYMTECWTLAQDQIDIYLNYYPDHANAISLRGKIYEALKLDGIAILSFQKAIDLKQQPKPIDFLLLANVLERYNPYKAIATLEKGIFILGNAAALENRLIEIAKNNEQYDLALKCIDVRLKKSPRKEKLLKEKADILLMNKEYQLAKHYYKNALSEINSLKPKHQNTKFINSLKSEIEQILYRF